MIFMFDTQIKKKLLDHMQEIATEKQNYCYQYTDGKGSYYVTDTYRVVEYNSEIQFSPAINVNAHADSITRIFSECFKKCENYVIYEELPTVAEIKANITRLAGRTHDKVIYGNDKFAVNARWLYKAMEALHAKVCYIDNGSPHVYGIALYENDNLQSTVRELILPIRADGKTGYWRK